MKNTLEMSIDQISLKGEKVLLVGGAGFIGHHLALGLKKVGAEVISLESLALGKLSKTINEDFVKAVELISQQNGKIIVSGVGKSGYIAGKIAASFTSTGMPAVYLNPVDASHGDMGIVEKNDVLIILSN